MNLEQFRSRVAQSAATAASVARHLSSLDEMAENDEYIKSESLNVPHIKKPWMPEILGGDNLVTLSRTEEIRSEHLLNPHITTKDSPWVRNDALRPVAIKEGDQSANVVTFVSDVDERSVVNNEAMPNQLSVQCKQLKQPSINGGMSLRNEMKESLLKRMNDKALKNNTVQYPGELLLNEQHAHILDKLNYDSENDSSDDEDQLACQSSMDNSISPEETRRHEKHEQTSKDPLRFIKMTEDAESEREEKCMNLPFAQSKTLSNADLEIGKVLWGNTSTAGDETNKAIRAGLSWVKNVATPQFQAFSNHIMTKIAETESDRFFLKSDVRETSKRGPIIGPRESTISQGCDPEMDIIMKSSSTFLDDEDRVELERLTNKYSSLHVVSMVQTCSESVKNPRLAFVGVTVIVALLVYFYNRRRIVSDIF